MIVISGTIGMGLFENSGEALNIAGPGGGIVAFAIVGIGVNCVMEGIAEMITEIHSQRTTTVNARPQSTHGCFSPKHPIFNL
jgi:amino acid permease